MATLLVAEHDDKTLNGATAKALTAAKGLGGEIHVLVAGSELQAGRGSRRPSSTASPRCCSPTRRSTRTGWPSRWRR